MALATQCPHCHTTFRVAHDQLKLRAGLVRCGACKQIFNGIENLLRPEDLQQPDARAPIPAPEPAPAPVPAESPPSPAAPIETNEAGDQRPADAVDEQPAPASPTEKTEEADETSEAVDGSGMPPASTRASYDDPLLRMTLMDFAHARQKPAGDENEPFLPNTEVPGGPDPLDQAIDDLQRKPLRWEQQAENNEADVDKDTDELDMADSDDFEEPSFVRQGRRRQRFGRAMHIALVAGTVLLLLALVAQATYVFRDQIAARFPQTKPVLTEVCAYLRCQVGLPAEIESVSIESNELQTLEADGDTFALTVLLRNRSTTAQAWPHIELTLNDSNEMPILRRVFTPREYLPPEHDPRLGFATKSEQAVKLYFQLTELKASGYRVYLFYP